MAKPNNILVITADKHSSDDTLSELSTQLGGIGYNVMHRCLTSKRIEGLPREAPKAVVIYFPYSEPPALLALIEKLRALYDVSHLPIVGILPPTIAQNVTDALSSTLFDAPNAKKVVSRIKKVLRMCDMRHEINMRLQTQSKITGEPYRLPSKQVQAKPIRILFIGKAAPEFMTLMNAFEGSSVEIVAAFTSFSAFDFLHEQRFNAVVINALSTTESALAITATLRRNSKFYHVPAFALMTEASPAQRIEAFEHGMSDVILADSHISDIHGRIIELASHHRMQEHIRSLYSSLGGHKCVDAETGLFNTAFFEAHLSQHMKKAVRDDVPLTLSVIKPIAISKDQNKTNVSFENNQSALSQIGNMIKNMLRIQDCTARITQSQFAILFPGKTPKEAETIIDRIRQIIDCTAFNSEHSAFKVELDVSTKLLTAPKAPPITHDTQLSA